MDKLAINTSESTKKKKKAKVDFVLDPKKASTLTADNNKPSKAKIIQKSGLYSVVKDLIETLAHIKFGQLITHPQFRKNFHKLLILKKKTPKTNKCSCQAELTDNNNVIPLICKAQVAGYFINLILDSRLSVSVIAKHFFEAIGRKIDDIAKAIPVYINDISIETNMEVSEAKEYTIIKAKVLLNYELCKLTIRYGKKSIVVKCLPKQNQEDEQSDESDDNESDDKEDQKKQKETTKLAYIIFTSNGKSLDNIKANKKRIMVNGKLICWFYYDILSKTFDKKSGKKAKYSY
ncbi:hypothetical protein G9A89_017010 [Geosiphon pyriformis]|nr:hypothetical protein G9A89_017010 [Geosiphon pyriformis]